MNVLLVDDDFSSLDSLNDFLGDLAGHQVTQCGNGEEALRHFESMPYHMVLTDLCMPGMTGIELLSRIKTLPQGHTSDVVIMTGFGDMQSAIEALRAGAYDYLQKPIVIEELVAIVKRITEHQSLLAENREFTHQFEAKVSEAVKNTEQKLDLL
jgi:DNA-binding NtrC family response regulator